MLLIPLWSFLAWFLWPSDRLEAVILDKSATPDSKKEHRSFNWILTHEKMYRPSGKDYDYSRDYYGTHQEGMEGLVHDLNNFQVSEMDSMSFYIDMAYFVDAKGVEMTVDSLQTGENWYGGLSEKDLELLKILYREHKLIIAEYNTLGQPTRTALRAEMEDLFEVDFTGWTGKAFASLDTTASSDIPDWVRKQYRTYYQRPFVFEDKPGIVLVHENGRIVVLEQGEHLEATMPVINTEISHQEKLGVSNLVNYPNWFDITLSKYPENVYSYYKIHTSDAGDSLMEYFNVPRRFPAVIGDHQENLRYYFCGDFADNDITPKTAYFKGVELISQLFYISDKGSRDRKFFWEFYRPMMTRLMKQYLARLKVDEEARLLPEDSNYTKYQMLDTGVVLLPKSGTRLVDTEELLSLSEPAETGPDAPEKTTTQAIDAKASSSGKPYLSVSRFKVGGRLPLSRWYKLKGSNIYKNTSEESEVEKPDASQPLRSNAQVTVEVPNPQSKQWRIIIASLRSAEKAQAYVDQLGYPELSIVYVDHLNTNRVAYGSYANLRDAQMQFQKVIKQHPDAWMVLF